jgi:hypothetical protein
MIYIYIYEIQARVHHLRTRSSLYEDELTEAYEFLELLRTALHDASSSHEAAVAAAVADTKEAVVLAQVWCSLALLVQEYLLTGTKVQILAVSAAVADTKEAVVLAQVRC